MGRLLEGYRLTGKSHRPRLEVASLYVDQFPVNDMAREQAAEYGVKVQREARDNGLGVLINDSGEVLPQYYGYRYNYYGYTEEAAGTEG